MQLNHPAPVAWFAIEIGGDRAFRNVRHVEIPSLLQSLFVENEGSIIRREVYLAPRADAIKNRLEQTNVIGLYVEDATGSAMDGTGWRIDDAQIKARASARQE